MDASQIRDEPLNFWGLIGLLKYCFATLMWSTCVRAYVRTAIYAPELTKLNYYPRNTHIDKRQSEIDLSREITDVILVVVIFDVMLFADNGACYDESEKCAQFARQGRCTNSALYKYANHCKKSCGLCGKWHPPQWATHIPGITHRNML